MGLNHTHRNIILVFSIYLTVSANENSQEYIHCKQGWYLFGDKCYKLLIEGSHPKFGPRGLDWMGSKNACAEFGGHLASIHSSDMQEFLTVFMLLNFKTEAWIGLHNNATGKDFYWDDGSIFNYSNWDHNEPRSSRIRFSPFQLHCARMVYDKFEDDVGKWSSRVTCSGHIPYICQVNETDNEFSPDSRFCSLEEGGGWKFRNSCYHIVKEEKSWEDAEKYCEERYEGYLVSVLNDNSERFLNYIQTLSNLSKNIWIGIKMRNNSMQKWASGWHVAYNQWNEELLQFVNGNCALKSDRYSWTVVPCLNKYPFICEKIKYNVPVLKRPPSDHWKCLNSSKKWLDLDGEFCYYIQTQNLRNWTEANNECMKIGGTLASFHSEDETNVLHPHVIDTQERLFIGLKRIHVDNNVFEWADGTAFIYRNWAWEQPNEWYRGEPIREGCGDLYTANMKWNVVPCNIARGYICKSKKEFSEMEETFRRLNVQHSKLEETFTTVPCTCAGSNDQTYSELSKLEEISTPVSCTCALSKDQTYSGSTPVGTLVGIVFCTFLVLVLLVGVIVYRYRNFLKRYCMKTENDCTNSIAPGFHCHVSEKSVNWKPLK